MFVQGRWDGRRYHHFEVPNPIETFKSISPEDRHAWLNENRNAFIRSVAENPLEVNRDDLSAVPVDVLL